MSFKSYKRRNDNFFNYDEFIVCTRVSQGWGVRQKTENATEKTGSGRLNINYLLYALLCALVCYNWKISTIPESLSQFQAF